MPDQPNLGNGCLTAQNVIPWKNGYRKFQSFGAITSALDARAQGFLSARDLQGNTYNFAGTAAKLWQYTTGTSFSDCTRTVGGAYGTQVDGSWEFVQFGNNVIAVNGFDAPQAITLGASNFIALAGSPPVARHIGTVRDFVVMGNIAGVAANRLQWSGINDATSWTPSLATQADYQDLPYGGWVQRILGGEYGVVLMDTAIVRMTYIGSPIIFELDVIERNRGVIGSQACAAWGNMIFFVAEDGFYVIIGGKAAVPIGGGKVDRTFLSDLQATYAYRVNCELDPINKVFYCHYPGSGSTSGRPNKILAYNWQENKWAGPINWDGDLLIRFASLGYTLEQLDTFSSSLDGLPFSLDSRAWTGGAWSLGGFDSSFRLGTFSGVAMAATVDTGEVELSAGRKSHIPYVRPLVDGEAVSVAVRTRDRLADSITTGASMTQSANGTCHTRAHSRYQSFRVTTSGEFNFIQGVEVAFDPGGLR